MTKRQEAALVTRQKIIDAVKELSGEKSYGEMSIDEITKKAGVAKGTFYVYFKRLEDVCADIAYDKSLKNADKIFKKRIPAKEKVELFIKESTKTVKNSTLGITQQWFKAVAAPLSGEENGMRKLEFDLSTVKKLLDEEIAEGDLEPATDTEGLSKKIVSEFYGRVMLWCMSDGKIKL